LVSSKLEWLLRKWMVLNGLWSSLGMSKGSKFSNQVAFLQAFGKEVA